MNTGVFYGRIQGGRFHPTYPRRLNAYTRALGDGPAVVAIRRPSKPRSIVSNRYYFGAVVRTIGDDLGYSDPEEMHEILAFKFLRVEDDPITGSPRRKRTRTMTTHEFQDYVSRVITWAETDMGIRIPRPGEWSGEEAPDHGRRALYPRRVGLVDA